MIDTVNDVVLRDIGDQIVNTGGVAVRPFWWSNECLEALGLKTYNLGPGGTSGDNGGGEDQEAGGMETGIQDELPDLQATGSTSSTALIVIITLLSMLLLSASVYIIKLSAKKKMISIPTIKSSLEPPQPPPQSSGFPSFCTNCGGALTPGSNFCPNCGRKI